MGQKLWLPKLMMKPLAISGTLKKWGRQTTNLCPRCGQPETNTSHPLQCPNPAATALWDNHITQLSFWMTAEETMSDIHKGILVALSNWRMTTPQKTFKPVSAAAAATLALQDAIGWTPFIPGFI